MPLPEPPPPLLVFAPGMQVEQPSARLLKHIVRCYLRLSDNPRAREALCRRASHFGPCRGANLGRCNSRLASLATLGGLVGLGAALILQKARVLFPAHPRAPARLTACHRRQCLPEPLRDATFSGCLKDDVTTKRWLTQLLFNISESAQLVG